MDKKSAWIQLYVHVLLISTCHGLYVGKRAVPNGDSSLHSNSNIVEEGTSAVPVTNHHFEDFWREKNGGLCPAGQINQRNNTVCCKPVSCGPGYEVLPCSVNGSDDTCKLCDHGFFQVNNVSSLNMLTATCFQQVKNHNDCPIDDYKPAREEFGHNFPLPCACKNEECYYPDNDRVSCLRIEYVCGEGLQMNLSGDCIPCEWYSYKNTTGCEPCTQNDNWLRNGRPDGNYVAPTSTKTTTTTTENNTATETTLEVERTEENRVKPEYEKTNVTTIIVIVISCIVFILVIVVIGMGVTHWKKYFPGQHPETQRPLLTTNTSEPVTPISVNGLGNGSVQNGDYHPIGVSQTLNGQYNTTNLQQNGLPLHANGQIGQYVDHMHVGTVGNTCSEHIASNGSSQNDRTMNNPDRHDLQLTLTSSKPCASKKLENEENQGKAQANHSLHDKEIMRASAGTSNKGIMTEVDTGKKERTPTTYLSIHGNKFENCQINIPLNKARLEEISGSFGMDSSSEFEMSHPVGQRPTAESTMVQPGRRDGYLFDGDNQPGHNQTRAYGYCRPEYNRTPLEQAHLQEAIAGRDGVSCEGVAMQTLDKPNYPCETSIDINTDLTEMVRNDVATVSGQERQQIQPTRRIATVAPMRPNDIQSIRHTSGYPSGGINVSDESASCAGTSLSSGYRIAGIASIADTGDFSTASDISGRNEGSHNDGMDTEATARKRQAMNEPPPVHHVTPLCQRESPDGHSGSHNDNGQNVGPVIDENTSEKVVAADETDVKQYVDWNPNTDEGMTDSHDSESDLKKPNEGLMKVDENDTTSSQVDVDSLVLYHSKNKHSSESFDTGEELMEPKNASEEFHDNEKDFNCDSRHIEGISNAAVNIPDSNENECVTVSESHVASELTDNSDGNLEETAADSSVEFNGNSLNLEINGNRNENGDLNDLEEESFEIDINEARDILPTQPSDDSYEIGDSVDIDAIHRENQRAQDITCRGETYDGLNSVQSDYKGITHM